ncbi:alpha amylase C-terminal domain-containing protein [Microbulbifer halophilus]|uniref:Alpha-amylase n=1 Tax=Microbulbifer halophilus TaxID=453963 RepID=A0ABW5E713_9GAMM|nr:alpha amylase C-terminal domain-containing protein [Microbulbifer halophilus]MCW8125899.1 alpha-amylase family glycosyl hydrolase [Microbulbifer halophilus]
MKPQTQTSNWFAGAAMVIGALASNNLSAGTAFVHLFEWRWNDIASECENFLGPKGYDAVQISPPQEHISHDTWWARYQPVTYTNLSSRSGTESELASMIQRCHAAGVKVYADAVINHTAAHNSGGTGWGGTPWSLTNHPEFSPADYHAGCDITDYGDAGNVWNCRLSGLPDLDTGSGYVRDTLAAYFNKLSNMGVDGFRIDAVKHMSPTDLDVILGAAGNPWVFSEVIGAAGEAAEIQPANYTHLGRVTEFKYGTDVAGNFNGQIKYLETIGESWGLLGSGKAVNFIDNHDRERGHGGGGNLTYKDGARYNLANIFMLAHPYGYPKIMSGYAFSDTEIGPPASGPQDCGNSAWVCQHRWGNIANMVGFRNHVDGTPLQNWWDNGDNQIAFSRGQKGFVVINNESGSLEQNLYTGLPAGAYCNVLDGDEPCSGDVISVGADGYAQFSVAANSAAAIHGGAPAAPCSDCIAQNFPQLYFRGTPNNWGTTAMDLVADNTWRTTVVFDGSSEQRFKFDVEGDWSWNYGDSDGDGILEQGGGDIHTPISGTYRVEVNDRTLTYSLACISDCGTLQSNLPSLHFRGTANSWGSTAMTLVADNTWEAIVSFDGSEDQRFKFDVYGDWTENYGDSDGDGILDRAGVDIPTVVNGSYRVTVDDTAMTYSLETE